MDETCCFCPRPAVDMIDERFPVCARCADACSVDEVPPHPWSGVFEAPADCLLPDAALSLLAIGGA